MGGFIHRLNMKNLHHQQKGNSRYPKITLKELFTSNHVRQCLKSMSSGNSRKRG